MKMKAWIAALVLAFLAAAEDRQAGLREVPPQEGPPDFEAMTEMREKRDAEIAAILNPEQKKLFEETRRGGPGGPPRRLDGNAAAHVRWRRTASPPPGK